MREPVSELGVSAALAKRAFDIVFALVGLALTFWIIALGWIISTLSTGSNGLFTQCRVGRHGKCFRLFKLRTMRTSFKQTTNVTTAHDMRITECGRFLRRTKLDELPQLFNVLIGDMSMVGPRPDVPGFADTLSGADRIILSVRPGITGPASLRFRDEEKLLALQQYPERYNRDVIFPEKVRINREYVQNYSFFADLKYIWKTLFG